LDECKPLDKGKAVRYAHMATAAVLPNGTMVTAWQASKLYEGAGDQRIYWAASVGRCRLTTAKPVLKAPMVSALETEGCCTAFKRCFQFQRAPLHHARLRRHVERAGGAGVARRGGGRGIHSSTSAQPEPIQSLID